MDTRANVEELARSLGIDPAHCSLVPPPASRTNSLAASESGHKHYQSVSKAAQMDLVCKTQQDFEFSNTPRGLHRGTLGDFQKAQIDAESVQGERRLSRRYSD